jgi:hypothetical protein
LSDKFTTEGTQDFESARRKTKNYFAEPKRDLQGKTKSGFWFGHGWHSAWSDSIVGNARKPRPREGQTDSRASLDFEHSEQAQPPSKENEQLNNF